ncbi:hypothetical protein AB3N04_00765 (plasmid) [Alkalihalophilus sp. As8PL]|uniref:Lipoprotein n=1 Tax=Alkalihalophilus sp. As8PL TaxID=3237103 RepID=A0AB39BNI8_9BACI
MKKLMLISSCTLLLLTGCGGGEDAALAAQEAATESWNLYTDAFTQIVDNSNVILSSYNDSMDNLYAGVLGNQQFKNQVKDLVPKSRELLALLDEVIYDVDSSLYEFHSHVLTLVNDQHHLLLITIQEADDDRINRENLRRQYVEIKKQQMDLIQQLKMIGEAQ